MKRCAAFVLLAFLTSTILTGTPFGEKPILAVLPLEPRGLSFEGAKHMTEALRDALAERSCFEIIPFEKAEALLKGRRPSSDVSTAAWIAKELCAQKAACGWVERVEGLYRFHIELIDAESGTADARNFSDQFFRPQDVPQALGLAAADLSTCLPRDGRKPVLSAADRQGRERFRKEAEPEVLRDLLSFKRKVAPEDQVRFLRLKDQWDYGRGMIGLGEASTAICVALAGLAYIFVPEYGYGDAYKPLLWAIPGVAVWVGGYFLKEDAESKIIGLAKKGQPSDWSLHIDPWRRVYALSFSFAF